MPCFACASIASRETLRHLVYLRTEYLVLLGLSKPSRQSFHSTSTSRLRPSPAASEQSDTFGLESSSKIDNVHVPLHGGLAKTKRHQRFSSDSKWMSASCSSYSKSQTELHDNSTPRIIGKHGTSQSNHLCSEYRVHRSSRHAVLRTKLRVSTATTDSQSEGHDSTAAFSDEKAAKESVEVNRTRRLRNPRFTMQSNGQTLRDKPKIDQVQGFRRRSKSEFLATSDSRVSLLKAPRESWQVQKKALLEKFGSSGWSPRKRLSPDALEGIRMLHSQSPDKYTTPVLADHFQVSPEAIRRILKSKWRPNEEEETKRRERWDKRGESIWSQMVEIGIKPPKKWRDMGVGKIKTRSVGTSVAHKPSIKETLLAAMKPWDSDEATKDGRAIRSPIPLSERIL